MSLPFTSPLDLPRRSSSSSSARRGSSASSVGSEDVHRPLSAGRPRSANRPMSGRPRSANRPLSAGFTTPTKSSLHRTGALRRRPMSAGPLGPLGHRPSPGEGPRSPANEMWVGGLRSDRPRTAPLRRRRSGSRPNSAVSAAPPSPAAAEAEEARHALAALEVDIDMEAAVRAAELSSDSQAYLVSPSPAKVAAANKAAEVAVAAAVAAEVAAEAAELERKAQLLAEHLANESFVGAMLEELVEEVVEQAEEARLAEAAIAITEAMVDKAVGKLIRATAVDAVRVVQEAAAAEETRLLRHASATRIAAAYRGYVVRKRNAERGQHTQWEEREQERVGEFEQALEFLAVHTSDFVDDELEATADEGRRIRLAAATGDRSGAPGESRAGAVLLDAPRPRMAAAMARMTSPSAYKLRKEKEARKAAAAALEPKPPVRKPEYEPPVVQMLEFEAHRQAGDARWEQGDAVAKGRIPPKVLEQMRARTTASLSIPQSSLPPGVRPPACLLHARFCAPLRWYCCVSCVSGFLPDLTCRCKLQTGKQLGVSQSLLCGDASVIAAFVERDRTALTSIDLSGNFALGVAGVARLAQALPNSSLQALNLSGCAVCGMCDRDVQRQKNFHEFKIEALLELADVLPETSLTSLDLSNCVLARPPLLGREPDLRAVEALSAALKRDDCPLVSLKLAGNALGDEGVAILAEALQEQHGHGSLTELDLSSTQILTLNANTVGEGEDDGSRVVEGRGLHELGVMLSLRGGNCSLSSLSLAGNELGLRLQPFEDAPVVRAASALADALICSELRSVDLRRTRLSLEDESVLALALLDAISVATLCVTPSWGGRRKRRSDGMSGKNRFKAAIGVTKLGVRAIEGGTRELDEEESLSPKAAEEEAEREPLSDEDQAAADAALAAGYLDSQDDRKLEGGTAATPRGTTVSTVALRYVEQLASEHGARLRSRRTVPSELEEPEQEQTEAAGFAPSGSTALHWVVARDPTAPNGVAWLRWLLVRRPESAGQRDAEGRTALDHARLRNNPEYVGLLQAAVEAACTFRTRYILTSAGVVDTDAGTTPRAVRYNGVDRSTGQRVTLRFYAGDAANAQGATAEAVALRRVASVRYTGQGGAVGIREPKARSLAAEGATLLVQNLVTTFDTLPPPSKGLDAVKRESVSVVVVEACSRSLAQLFDERRCFAPPPPMPMSAAAVDQLQTGLAATDPAVAALGLDGGVAANAAVVSTLAISFLPTEEVRSLSRQLLYSLVWLHENCRTSHCDIHPGSIGQFHDGGWRFINLGHARHFASPLPFPVRARTCAPELARQLVAEIDALLDPKQEQPEDRPMPPVPSSGIVTVEVKSGMGLLAADRGGVSDPFVRLQLGDQREETAPQKKTSAPRFHQAFDFPAALLGGSEPLLKLQVFDWDRGSTNDFLGEVSIDVAALLGAEIWKDGVLVEPLPLELGDPGARLSKKCKKQAASRGPGEAACGTITVSISYARGDPDEDESGHQDVQPEEEEPVDADFNTVMGSLLSVWSYDMWGLGVLLLEAATARAWDAVGAEEHVASIAGGVGASTSPTEAQLRRLAAITPEEIEIRIKEVSDDELADLLSMLLTLRPEDRPTAEQLLGKGGGQVRPHRFLCHRGEEAYGWTDADRRRLKQLRPPPGIQRR